MGQRQSTSNDDDSWLPNSVAGHNFIHIIACRKDEITRKWIDHVIGKGCSLRMSGITGGLVTGVGSFRLSGPLARDEDDLDHILMTLQAHKEEDSADKIRGMIFVHSAAFNLEKMMAKTEALGIPRTRMSTVLLDETYEKVELVSLKSMVQQFSGDIDMDVVRANWAKLFPDAQKRVWDERIQRKEAAEKRRAAERDPDLVIFGPRDDPDQLRTVKWELLPGVTFEQIQAALTGLVEPYFKRRKIDNDNTDSKKAYEESNGESHPTQTSNSDNSQ